MKALFKNLIDFFSNKKKFFLIQFIIILIFTSIFTFLNLKKSFHFKVKYNVGYDNQKLLVGISDSFNILFYQTLDSIFDSNSKIQKLKTKGVEIDFPNPQKFLDLGYSNIKDIFFVKHSRLDIKNYKIEIVSNNKNFNIDEYKAAYNNRVRNYLINERYKNEKTLKDIKDFVRRSDKTAYFDNFLNRYDLKYSILKDLVGKENIVMTDDISFYYAQCETDVSGKNDEYFYQLTNNITLSFLDVIKKKVDIDSLKPEQFLRYLNCSIQKNFVKTKNKKFFLKEKLINLLNEVDVTENQGEILETIRAYIVTPHTYTSENDKYKFYLFNKDTVNEKIKIILENDKKRIFKNLDILIRKIDGNIKEIKNRDFIEFEELYSEYSFKYKILDFLKYFIFFFFGNFI